jgi:hypothetical protein
VLLCARVAKRGDVKLVHGVTLKKPPALREATLAERLIRASSFKGSRNDR